MIEIEVCDADERTLFLSIYDEPSNSSNYFAAW
jgi:hypothetical protein